MTQLWAIGLVIAAAVLGALGQLNFKLGSDNLSLKISDLLRNRYLFIGVILYGISTVMFIVALKGGELSVLYPLVATSYIWTTLLAKKVLNEKINVYKWAGVAMIMLGVVFII